MCQVPVWKCKYHQNKRLHIIIGIKIWKKKEKLTKNLYIASSVFLIFQYCHVTLITDWYIINEHNWLIYYKWTLLIEIISIGFALVRPSISKRLLLGTENNSFSFHKYCWVRFQCLVGYFRNKEVPNECPLIRMSVHLKILFCDKGGKVGSSVFYEHISSFFEVFSVVFSIFFLFFAYFNHSGIF